MQCPNSSVGLDSRTSWQKPIATHQEARTGRPTRHARAATPTRPTNPTSQAFRKPSNSTSLWTSAGARRLSRRWTGATPFSATAETPTLFVPARARLPCLHEARHPRRRLLLHHHRLRAQVRRRHRRHLQVQAHHRHRHRHPAPARLLQASRLHTRPLGRQPHRFLHQSTSMCTTAATLIIV